jgi:hypothetical protein
VKSLYTGLASACGEIALQNSMVLWMKAGREFLAGLRPALPFAECELASAAPARCSAYTQQAAAKGGAWRRSLTSLFRFCAVAVSSTSSLAPLKPRSRSRSSLRMRFIYANRISTFLRFWRGCWKASVSANARTLSRTSSLRSRVTLRTAAVVHRGFSEQAEQSFLLAL